MEHPPRGCECRFILTANKFFASSLSNRQGRSKPIGSNRGPGFIAKVIQTWLRDNRIQTNLLSEIRVVFEDWRSLQ